MADLAQRLYTARHSRAALLMKVEGESSYVGQQTFVQVTPPLDCPGAAAVAVLIHCGEALTGG